MGVLTKDQKRIANIYLLSHETAQQIVDAKELKSEGLTNAEIAKALLVTEDRIPELLNSRYMV